MVILIIEDEALLGMSLAWELEEAGHKVLGPVSSTAAARRLAARERPDLALIDIDLQDQQPGIELARDLRQQFGVASLLLTSEPNAIRSYTDAVLGVIAKPFNPVEIRRSVAVAKSVLNGRSPASATIPRMLEIFEPRALSASSVTPPA